MPNSVSKTNYPVSFLAIVTSGLITGVLQVVLSISYAALVYGGKLSPFVGQGIGFALIGAFVIAAIITIFSALPGPVGSNQDVSVAIFSLLSVSIVATMPLNASLESAFCTVVIAIALTVLLTGLFFWGLGTFKLGGLIRYFPYPVVGGFLAGTGWLLFIGGFSLATGEYSSSDLLQPYFLVRWLSSFAFAMMLLVLIKRFRNNWALPGGIIAGVLLFYSIAWYFGRSPEKLIGEGWLLGPFPDQVLWQPFTLTQFTLVHWDVIAGQAANIATVLTVSSISLLLNASAFELEAKQDIDLDKELRLAGIANFFSSLFPGFVGFRQLSLTVLNFRMKAQSRLVGLIGVTIIALTLFFGASIISYFPKVIMGGLLMYLGLTFLVEWAYETWFTLPTIDFAIIWLVLVVIATVGFMPGVTVGLLAAVIMFVVSYSRTDVVRHELTGKSYQSLIPRRPDQRQVLDAQREQIYILQLQGFIFFGTANRLFNKIKKRLGDTNTLPFVYVVLDFDRVDVLDSTGMLSFRKLKDLTNASQSHLIITAPSPEIQQQLTKGGLCSSHSLTHYFPCLTSGIDWCEDQILRKTKKQKVIPLSLVQQLEASLPNSNHVPSLLRCLERFEVEAGTTLIRYGEPADAFFFIESGQITTKVKDLNDSLFHHLKTDKKGLVVGDIGFYLGHTRTADVIATEQCVIYRLSTEKLKYLEKSNPKVGSSD